MPEVEPELKVIMRRPIDCPPEMHKRFIEIVMEGGETLLPNLQRGVPMANMLFFGLVGREIAGVCCARYQNVHYHKHLFIQAGVPEMYNPYSLEICWLSVLPKYRRKGIFKQFITQWDGYLKDRPAHAITRVANAPVANPARFGPNYHEVGEPFYTDNSDDLIQLTVTNHDPVFEPKKRLRYC
ncbi:hypothetical protein [Sneathiella limimaris]|uniref:hypothetical protein n=1 Tax=Sneathiella limimaris TaxID=1964213 RepID=UPI00146A88A9|nr:hypothetical protein [Sneathiella limimaris]